jgi:CheY-like chemotaxis protein
VTLVLVVDDEFGIVDSLTDVLGESGFTVASAANGKDGLRRVAERHPDVILLDYMMPVMDGPEMLRQLQTDPQLQQIPVIMMSAVPRSSLPQSCTPNGFLRKPFDLHALFAELERLLGAAGRAT